MVHVLAPSPSFLNSLHTVLVLEVEIHGPVFKFKEQLLHHVFPVSLAIVSNCNFPLCFLKIRGYPCMSVRGHTRARVHAHRASSHEQGEGFPVVAWHGSAWPSGPAASLSSEPVSQTQQDSMSSGFLSECSSVWSPREGGEAVGPRVGVGEACAAEEGLLSHGARSVPCPLLSCGSARLRCRGAARISGRGLEAGVPCGRSPVPGVGYSASPSPRAWVPGPS